MVLGLKILNSDAQLNTFFDIGTLEFVPGKPLTAFIRLIQPAKQDLRFCLSDSPAVVETTLLKSDETTLTKSLSLAFEDKDTSVLKLELSAAETEGLISQSICLDIEDDGILYTACKQMAIKVNKASGSC